MENKTMKSIHEKVMDDLQSEWNQDSCYHQISALVMYLIKQGIIKEETEKKDICGLCGLPGADKFAHPEHWPGEKVPDSELVHVYCEDEETKRAHVALSGEQRKAFLSGI